MEITTKKAIPIVLFSMVLVTTLQLLSYQSIIQIAQAKFNSTPAKLILELLATIIIHTALLSAIPLALAAFNKKLISYITLALLSSMYITFTTGVNAIGPAVVFTIFVFLAIYAYRKAFDIYNYFRAK